MINKKNKFKGYIYLLPALIILAVFVFYPILNTIIFSFDETKASGFVFGFGSYKYLIYYSLIIYITTYYYLQSQKLLYI